MSTMVLKAKMSLLSASQAEREPVLISILWAKTPVAELLLDLIPGDELITPPSFIREKRARLNFAPPQLCKPPKQSSPPLCPYWPRFSCTGLSERAICAILESLFKSVILMKMRINWYFCTRRRKWILVVRKIHEAGENVSACCL